MFALLAHYIIIYMRMVISRGRKHTLVIRHLGREHTEIYTHSHHTAIMTICQTSIKLIPLCALTTPRNLAQGADTRVCLVIDKIVIIVQT